MRYRRLSDQVETTTVKFQVFGRATIGLLFWCSTGFASTILQLDIPDPVRTAKFLDLLPITAVVTNTLSTPVPLESYNLISSSYEGAIPTALFYFTVPGNSSVPHVLWYFRVFPGLSHVGTYTYDLQLVSSLLDASGQRDVSNFARLTINIVSAPDAAIPEPAPLVMMAMGAGFLVLLRSLSKTPLGGTRDF